MSFFIIQKAQVEAKKEHEGAVQLLEVSEPALLAFFPGVSELRACCVNAL